MQVKNFAMSRLSNSFHASFHHAVVTQVSEVGDSPLGLYDGFCAQYLASVNKEQDIVNRTLGSAKTETLRAADELRDRYFRAVRNVLRNTKNASSDSIRDLYDVINKKLIKPYPGSMTNEGDHQESSHIRGFIYDVRQFLTAEQINKLGIKEDLEAMEAANEEFEAIYLERVEEQVQNPAGFGLECRKEVDAHWARLVRTLDYYANEGDNPDSGIKSIATTAKSALELLNKHIASVMRSVNASGSQGENSGSDNGNSGTGTGSTEKPTEKPTTDKPIDKPLDNGDSGYNGDL